MTRIRGDPSAPEPQIQARPVSIRSAKLRRRSRHRHSLLSSSTKARFYSQGGDIQAPGGSRRPRPRVAERSPSRLSSAAARGALAARRIDRLSRKCPFVKPSSRCPCPKPPRLAESPRPRKLPRAAPQCLWLRIRSRRRRRRRPSAMTAPPRRASACACAWDRRRGACGVGVGVGRARFYSRRDRPELSGSPAGRPAGPPQIRTCRFPASGSSRGGFATCRTGGRCAAVAAETAAAVRASPSSS
jgi:hypothetical protein